MPLVLANSLSVRTDAQPNATRQGTARPLYVAYFCPADRDPLPGYRERIGRIMDQVQAFYRDGMEANGYGPVTFSLERDAEGQLVVHLARGEHEAVYYDPGRGGEVRSVVGDELARAGIDIERETVVIFQNLILVEDGELRPNCPYYGGGGHVSGTAWVTDHELLDTENLTDTESFLLDRGRRMSVGRYNTIMQGGVAHELGHALGLPHVTANGAEAPRGTALMGSGNYTYFEELRGEGKGSFLTAASSLVLASHPLFRHSDDLRDAPVDCELVELGCTHEDGAMEVRGRVASSLPTYGVVAYNDPEGGQDYNSLSWVAEVAADGSFTVPVRDLTPGVWELRLRFMHTNGDSHTYGFVYRVDQTGVPDCPAIEMQLDLARAVAAFDAHDSAALAACVERIHSAADRVPEEERTADQGACLAKAEWLQGQLALPPGLPAAPADAPDAITSASLSGFAWESASVLWPGPERDRLPEGMGQRFLESSERFHASGLWAHAPSKYVFRLGRAWARFVSSYGLQRGNDGSVVFVVTADGREVFRSDVVNGPGERELDLDVTGVDMLELAVESGDDGDYGDGSVWLSPRLER